MNETTYTNEHYQALQMIPMFSGSARLVDLLRGFDALMVDDVNAILNLLVADGLVERIQQRHGCTYAITAFGKLVGNAYRDAGAVWTHIWIGTDNYDIVIYGVPHAIQSPFVCWRVRNLNGSFIDEGGALNERQAWQFVKGVLEGQMQTKGVQA